MDKCNLFVKTLHINKLRKSLERTGILLLHIPKTAGTTIYNLIKNKIDITYVHMLGESSASFYFIDYVLENPDIKVIISWRYPLDHIISTFNFFNKFDNYDIPDVFEEFIAKYSNIQIQYLTHEPFLKDFENVTRDDYNKVLKLIERDNTLCLLADCLEQGVEKVNKFLDINIEYDGKYKMFNFDKTPISLSEEIKTNILSDNSLDLEIYEVMMDKYNYQKSAQPIIVESETIPYYFPYNWFNFKEQLEEMRERLKHDRDSIIKDIKYISIEDYIHDWLEIYPEFKEKYNMLDILCFRLYFNNKI